jgi:polyhydroxybutyrate depolymerase
MIKNRWASITLLAGIIVASMVSCRQLTSAGDLERKLTIHDVERSYLLHIPPGLDSTRSAPLLLAFHGAGDDPAEMQLLTGFNEIADQSGFGVAYPVGIGQSWNAGGKCCGEALTKNIDDVAFVRQLLSDLETLIRVDPKRVYATGFSNGGAFADRLACEMSDMFAAVASVAGILSYSPCKLQQPISVMHVHGMADSILPYEGGGSFEIRPVEEIMSNWAELNGCVDSPAVDNSMKTIKHIAYSSCQAGTTVELYAIEGTGHDWPSKDGWDTSQRIWDFFIAHPKE